MRNTEDKLPSLTILKGIIHAVLYHNVMQNGQLATQVQRCIAVFYKVFYIETVVYFTKRVKAVFYIETVVYYKRQEFRASKTALHNLNTKHFLLSAPL